METKCCTISHGIFFLEFFHGMFKFQVCLILFSLGCKFVVFVKHDPWIGNRTLVGERLVALGEFARHFY
jgi:hypothetical protein